jgi:hypothetical protein
MSKLKPIPAGTKFGNLTILGLIDERRNEKVVYKCQCICGTITNVVVDNLRSGNTKSCGCGRSQFDGKLPVGQAHTNYILRVYKYGAKVRNLDWELTMEFAVNLMLQPCSYCGQLPQLAKLGKGRKHNGLIPYNGLDRVDNTQGYYSNNVVACCNSCNIAKRDRNLSEFMNWVRQTYEHLNSKGVYGASN